MHSDQRTSDESVPPAGPWPSDVTPEEIAAFEREDALKLVLRNARIFLMSGVVLILFFAFPSVAYSKRYLFARLGDIPLAPLYCVLGPVLLIAGVGLRKTWAWARYLSLGMAWLGIPVVLVLAVLLVRMVVGASRIVFDQSVNVWLPGGIFAVMITPVVIIALLVIRKYVRFLGKEHVRGLFR